MTNDYGVEDKLHEPFWQHGSPCVDVIQDSLSCVKLLIGFREL